MKEHNILHTGFDLLSYEDVMARILRWKEQRQWHYVTLTPPYSVMMCQHDDVLALATQGAALTLPDGVGIILAARLLGYPHRGRVAGPTLMLKLCDWGRERGIRHFFYGGAPGVGEALAGKLSARFPGMIVAGTCSPPFRQLTFEEDEAVIRQIRSCHPDIVWVGLGSPKQERWMAEHVGRTEAVALIGVGAAFDFHSERMKWAPAWMRLAGLEWAYRLAKEPRRMWRRDIAGVVFLAKVCLQKAFGLPQDSGIGDVSGRQTSSGGVSQGAADGVSVRRTGGWEGPERYNVGRIAVSTVNMDTCLGLIRERVQQKAPAYICAANVEAAVLSQRDDEFCRIQNESFLTVPDGMPLVLYGRLIGQKRVRRVTGPDLMCEVLRMSPLHGYTHYFYGDTEETLTKMKQVILDRYPGVTILGTHSPPFRPPTADELDATVAEINRLHPSFVWVALGCPTQEVWMARVLPRVEASILIGVGAAFRFLIGEYTHPHRIWQMCALEGVWWRARRCPGATLRWYSRYVPAFGYLAFKGLAWRFAHPQASGSVPSSSGER